MSEGSAVVVLIDADNVDRHRLSVLVGVLAEAATGAAITVAGRPEALQRTDWPAGSTQVPASGWQAADLALAAAYRPGRYPLILASGDGDFGLLATGHPGPVLVVSALPSARLRGPGRVVVDPALTGPQPLRDWLQAVTPEQPLT